MPTIQVNATLSRQELLQAMAQLNSDELKEFMEEISALYARRQAPHLPQREAELLQKVNKGFPDTIWKPYKSLLARRQAEQLTSSEQEELIRLSNEIEQIHAERIASMAELARLRNMTLPDLMNALGIYPLADV